MSGGIHHQWSRWGLEYISPITSPCSLYLKAVWYSAECFDSFIMEKTNLLTWPVQAVGASEKSQETVTQKLHCAVGSLCHCLHCVSPPTSVQSTSQETHKIQVRHPRKMPLYGRSAAVCAGHSHEDMNAHCAPCAQDRQAGYGDKDISGCW